LKKIISVVGARPQFIKCAALSKQIRKHFTEIIIHTGQHYDYEMSKSFFDELGIPEPNYNLEIGSGKPAWQIASMMIKLEEIFEKEKPDCVIVFGDTNSTAAATIAAVKNNIKVAHIEAGLREFDKSIPEETNKLITDALCDYYFCPTPTAVSILKNMGITEHVYNVGDVMIDIIEDNFEKIKSNNSILLKNNVQEKNYVFVTCHRAANTDNIENLKQILIALNEIKYSLIFALHPRTKKIIEQNNLEYLLESPYIKVVNPLGYFDTQTLIHCAKYVITDSGGVTKEAYYHKVQGILIDKQTEWVETLNEGWNFQAGPNTKKILENIAMLGSPKAQKNCLGNGDASIKIATILNEVLKK